MFRENVLIARTFDIEGVNVSFGSWQNCVYCGLPASCQDHVIPFSFFSVKTRHNGNSPGVKVKACCQCNGILSDFYYPTLAKRTEAVQARLKVKGKRLLRLPVWTVAELRELSYELREMFKRNEVLRRQLVRRLEWQQSVNGVHYLLNLRDEVQSEFPAPKHPMRAFFQC